MLGFLIGLVVTIGVAWLIIKKYQAHTILLLAGLLLLTLTLFVAPETSILFKKAKSTGLSLFDIFDYVRGSLAFRAAGLGMIIMAAGGFAKYMDHIGATDAMVNVAIRPLGLLNAPYVVLGARLCGGAVPQYLHPQCGRSCHAVAGHILPHLGAAWRQPGGGSGDDRHHSGA